MHDHTQQACGEAAPHVQIRNLTCIAVIKSMVLAPIHASRGSAQSQMQKGGRAVPLGAVATLSELLKNRGLERSTDATPGSEVTAQAAAANIVPLMKNLAANISCRGAPLVARERSQTQVALTTH
jgi:hypothetical protein